MRGLTGLGVDASFSQLVDCASGKNAAVRMEGARLKDYGDLRNAIVHHRAYPREIIAEPSEEVVARFRKVVESVLSPKLLIPTFQREVKCFAPNDPLAEALRYMGANDYSQVVVRMEKRLSLLTVEGIASWLERNVAEDIISVRDARIADVHTFEAPNGHVIMRRNDTVYEARGAFARAIEEGRPRLFAIIVTQSGKETEAPLGIVTPWDLLDGGNG